MIKKLTLVHVGNDGGANKVAVGVIIDLHNQIYLMVDLLLYVPTLTFLPSSRIVAPSFSAEAMRLSILALASGEITGGTSDDAS